MATGDGGARAPALTTTRPEHGGVLGSRLLRLAGPSDGLLCRTRYGLHSVVLPLDRHRRTIRSLWGGPSVCRSALPSQSEYSERHSGARPLPKAHESAMTSRNTLKLASTVRLAAPSGHVEMPVVGFGVYQSTDTLSSSKTAFEAGYRHIDTARAYKSESVVNDALRASSVPTTSSSKAAADPAQRRGMKRSDVFLTTKVMSGEHGYDACAKAVESSAQALEGGIWDLYLIHAPTSGKAKRVEAFKALGKPSPVFAQHCADARP